MVKWKNMNPRWGARVEIEICSNAVAVTSSPYQINTSNKLSKQIHFIENNSQQEVFHFQQLLSQPLLNLTQYKKVSV